jgi:glucosyl-3-phosphoglycerate phosphatase
VPRDGTSRTWYLVRHGETEWNAASRMQGHLDSQLTPLGRIHARSSGELLERLGVDLMFASPLGRVRETVAIVSEHVSLSAIFDDRLREWSAGEWSGELIAELPMKWPDVWATWDADRYHQRPPGGENFLDLIDRAGSFLKDAASITGERVAIIAHGFFNRALASVLLNLSPLDTMRIDQPNDTVMRIVVRNGQPIAEHFVNGEGPRPGLPARQSLTPQSM